MDKNTIPTTEGVLEPAQLPKIESIAYIDSADPLRVEKLRLENALLALKLEDKVGGSDFHEEDTETERTAKSALLQYNSPDFGIPISPAEDAAQTTYDSMAYELDEAKAKLREYEDAHERLKLEHEDLRKLYAATDEALSKEALKAAGVKFSLGELVNKLEGRGGIAGLLYKITTPVEAMVSALAARIED